MKYDKNELNAFVQNLYDQKMEEGKHGHYESLFHVVHKAIDRVQPTDAHIMEVARRQFLMPDETRMVDFVREVLNG